MTQPSDRLRLIRELFDQAMERPPAERIAWLDQAASWDADVRAEVRGLLAIAETTDSFLGDPVGAALLGGLPGGGLHAGQRLGSYEVVRLVGMGGMGAVYEAVRADDQYRKRVAIKLVQRGLDSELTLVRFRRERQILANLEHRNIATLLDGGVSPEGRPFLVMEYVEGKPITEWCDERTLTIGDRIALFRQVCAAVEHAHKNLIIHRDLKPGNILVTSDGTVKLLDFGIAKLLAENPAPDGTPLTLGDLPAFTPQYASPEQLRGDVLTTASDVYSLGVVLFELLTGRRPHLTDRRSVLEIARLVLDEPVPRPSAVVTDAGAGKVGERSAARLARALAGELDNIVLMALRMEPERRYGSVEALGSDLHRFRLGRPVKAEPDWAGYRLKKFVQRNTGAVVASLLALAALAGGVIATSRESRRLRAEQAKAIQVSGFLRQLLSSVQPETGGRDVPVSEVLARAASRMDSGLAEQAGVRGELESVLGQSYLSLGRLDDAERHFRQEEALARQVEGPASQAAAWGRYHLGTVYAGKGELERADTEFIAALEIERKRSRSPDTLIVAALSSRASLEHDRGRLAAAEKLHREVLALKRTIEGDSSDGVATTLNNIGVSVGEQNRWPEADSLHRLAVAILRRNHPEPNAALAGALSSLASVLDFENKSTAADSAYRDVLALRLKLLGPNHPDYNFTLYNYADFLLERGRPAEALEMARQVLSHRGTTMPDTHPVIAATLLAYGESLDALGRFAEGGPPLEESVALRRKIYPPDHWLIGNSERHLGQHYIKAKQYSTAEPILLHADAVVEKALGPTHPRSQDAIKALVDLYQNWGRPAQAAEYRAKLIKPS